MATAAITPEERELMIFMSSWKCLKMIGEEEGRLATKEKESGAVFQETYWEGVQRRSLEAYRIVEERKRVEIAARQQNADY
jgi:hypothetical protein